MHSVDAVSEVRSEFHFGNIIVDSEGGRDLMSTVAGGRKDALYKAVMALSRSIAGRTDLRSLLSGVAESLRQIVIFDHVAVILHHADENAMQGYILNEPGNPVMTDLRLPVDQDPAGWVW